MSTVRKLTEDGDLEYVAGKQVMISDEDASAQAVSVHLQTLQGENLFHPGMGIDLDYLTRAGADGRRAVIEAALIRSGRIQRIVAIEELAPLNKRKQFRALIRAELPDGGGPVEFNLAFG